MKKSIFILLALFSLSLFGQTTDSEETKELTKMTLFIWCFLGCAIQEFIYWFELRHEIAAGNSPPMSNAGVYWIITILGVIIFSIASFLYFWYGEKGTPNFFTTAVFSAGFPRLFKAAVSKLQTPTTTTTPRKLVRKFTLKDYFMIKN